MAARRAQRCKLTWELAGGAPQLAAADMASAEPLSCSVKLWAQACVRKARLAEHNLEYKAQLETGDYDIVAQQLLMIGCGSTSTLHSALQSLASSPRASTLTKFAGVVLQSLFDKYKSIVLNECEAEFSAQVRRGDVSCRSEYFERVTFDTCLQSDLYRKHVANQSKYMYDSTHRALNVIRQGLRCRSARSASSWMPASSSLSQALDELVRSLQKAEAELSGRASQREQLRLCKAQVKEPLEAGVLKLKVHQQRMMHLRVLDVDTSASELGVKRQLLDWTSQWLDWGRQESRAQLAARLADELAGVAQSLDSTLISELDERLASAARDYFELEQRRHVALTARSVVASVKLDVESLSACKEPALLDAIERLSAVAQALPSELEPEEASAVGGRERLAFERAAQQSAQASARLDVLQLKDTTLRQMKSAMEQKKFFAGLTGSWRRALELVLEQRQLAFADDVETPALASYECMMLRLSDECEASTPASRQALRQLPFSCLRAYEVVLRLASTHLELARRKLGVQLRVPPPLDEHLDFELPHAWVEQLQAVNPGLSLSLGRLAKVRLADVAAALAAQLNARALESD